MPKSSKYGKYHKNAVGRYECPHCALTFSANYSVGRHIDKIHGDTVGSRNWWSEKDKALFARFHSPQGVENGLAVEFSPPFPRAYYEALAEKIGTKNWKQVRDRFYYQRRRIRKSHGARASTVVPTQEISQLSLEESHRARASKGRTKKIHGDTVGSRNWWSEKDKALFARFHSPQGVENGLAVEFSPPFPRAYYEALAEKIGTKNWKQVRDRFYYQRRRIRKSHGARASTVVPTQEISQLSLEESHRARASTVVPTQEISQLSLEEHNRAKVWNVAV